MISVSSPLKWLLAFGAPLTVDSGTLPKTPAFDRIPNQPLVARTGLRFGNDEHRALKQTRAGERALLDALKDSKKYEVKLAHQTGMGIDQKKIPALRALERFVTRFANDPKIAHDYIRNDCQARAHAACVELRKLGIAPRKLFVYPQERNTDDTQLRGKNDFFDVSWNFHNAVLVYVQHKGRVEPRVIDASFAARPLTMDEWLGFFCVETKLKLDVTTDAQYGTIDYAGEQGDFEGLLPYMRRRLEHGRRVMEEYLRKGLPEPLELPRIEYEVRLRIDMPFREVL